MVAVNGLTCTGQFSRNLSMQALIGSERIAMPSQPVRTLIDTVVYISCLRTFSKALFACLQASCVCFASCECVQVDMMRSHA